MEVSPGELPAGRLLSVDELAIYGFSYKPEFYRGATGREYHAFALDKQDQLPVGPPDYARANRDYSPNRPGKFRVKFRWQSDVPMLARSLVLADDTLFMAGPPEAANRSMLAFSGRQGGVLCAVSAKDGTTFRQYWLESLPVFDGMAAAHQRLYVSMQDGCLLCLGDGAAASDATELPEL